MADQITLRWLKSPEQIAAGLGALLVVIMDELDQQLTVSMHDLREYIVATKLSGQVLHQRTGNLIDSTQPHTIRTGDTQLEGNVAVGREAPYGRWQEYGAHIPERRPINARALHWVSGGKDVFAMKARAFDLPARSFMLSSFGEMREQIITDLKGAVARGTSK